MLGQVAQTETLTRLEDDARRTHQLRHDDTLGAVDDEGALVGHHREVAHEHRLLFDLTGVRVHEPRPHENRRGIGHVLLFALLHRELGRWAQVFVVGIELELELQRLAEVLDRRDVVERLCDALLQEPLERITLNRNQIGQLEGLLEIAERIAVPGYRARRHEYSSEGVQTNGPGPDAIGDLVRGSAGARARVTGENRETEKLRNAKRERAGTATREHNPGGEDTQPPESTLTHALTAPRWAAG